MARRTTALTLAAAVILIVAACSSSESGDTTAGGVGGHGSGGGGAGGSGGVPGCGTCAAVFTNGGVVCDDTSSSDALTTLKACACQEPKATMVCGASLCADLPSDATCGTYLEASCAAAAMSCAAN